MATELYHHLLGKCSLHDEYVEIGSDNSRKHLSKIINLFDYIKESGIKETEVIEGQRPIFDGKARTNSRVSIWSVDDYNYLLSTIIDIEIAGRPPINKDNLGVLDTRIAEFYSKIPGDNPLEVNMKGTNYCLILTMNDKEKLELVITELKED